MISTEGNVPSTKYIFKWVRWNGTTNKVNDLGRCFVNVYPSQVYRSSLPTGPPPAASGHASLQDVPFGCSWDIYHRYYHSRDEKTEETQSRRKPSSWKKRARGHLSSGGWVQRVGNFVKNRLVNVLGKVTLQTNLFVFCETTSIREIVLCFGIQDHEYEPCIPPGYEWFIVVSHDQRTVHEIKVVVLGSLHDDAEQQSWNGCDETCRMRGVAARVGFVLTQQVQWLFGSRWRDSAWRMRDIWTRSLRRPWRIFTMFFLIGLHLFYLSSHRRFT